MYSLYDIGVVKEITPGAPTSGITRPNIGVLSGIHRPKQPTVSLYPEELAPLQRIIITTLSPLLMTGESRFTDPS